jgi:non-ribosomal peptide synthetase component F
VSPFHFDGSFATLFPPVVAGGSLVIPPRESLLFPRYFFRTLARERITLTGFSPSYLRLLLASPQLAGLADSALDILPLGGEACPASDIAKLWDAAPRVRLFNRYGPTETTIAVSHFEITREVLARGGAISIGKPHPDSTFHLVDEDGRLIDEPDRVGELYIGGARSCPATGARLS